MCKVLLTLADPKVWCLSAFHRHITPLQKEIDVYVLQVKIKFRLKLFNPGWFYISLICLLAFIIQELGLGEEGNNFLWESM